MIACAYDAAIIKSARRELPLVITNRPVVPDRVAWLLTEMLKTTSRTATAPATFAADRSDANICEQCDNFTTSTEFLPQLQARLADSI